MTLFVGTSGWAYKEWKPDFYPAETKQKEFLSHYSSLLSASEINATFYRLQKHETFARWAQEVPSDFRFSIKAHRRLTHGRSISPEEDQGEFLTAFLRSLQPLEDRLGALLFQFPPYRKKDVSSLAALMDRLPTEKCAFEFRDPSWEDEEVTEMIVQRGGTVCVADTSGASPTMLPGGRIAYIRMRFDDYSVDQRASWLRLLESESRERNVFAFTKHEGVAANNPFAGVGLAVWLQEQNQRGESARQD